MVIEQTPILRDADVEKNAYRGFAMAQMRILKDYMQVSGLNSYSRVVTLANGVVITCQKSFNREDVFVSVPALVEFTPTVISEVMGSFICNPREFGINDGYHYVNGELIPFGVGDIQYPFGSAYNSSAVVTVPDKSTDPDVAVSRTVMQYGNIDWKDGKDKVLTWKGPPGRSIPFDNTIPIYGLTVPDMAIAEEERYTCFFPFVYSRGELFKEFPLPPDADWAPKVLGAAVQENGMFVCVANNHYASRVGFFEEVWSNNGDPAFYSAVEHPNGWRKLSERFAGRPTSIWAFSADGTRATQGVFEYTLDTDAGTAGFTTVDAGGIQCVLNNSDPNGAHSSTYSGECITWSDYKGNDRVFATVAATGGHIFAAENTASSTSADVPRYVLRKPIVVEPYISNDGNGQYSFHGDYEECCDAVVEWSMVGGTITQTGLVTAMTGCGMGSITASICNASVTIPVVLQSGVWVLTSSCSTSCGGTTHTYIAGGTKTVETIADIWGGNNGCGHITVDYYSENTNPRCNRDVQLSNCSYWDVPQNCGSSCGAPTVPYTPTTTDPSPATGSYVGCDSLGNPTGTITYAIEHRHTVACTARQIYTWSCPP